jgi:co-chaperonin GroES (HSP10)
MNKPSLVTPLRIFMVSCLLLGAVCWCRGAHKEFQTGTLLDIGSDEKVKKGNSSEYAIYQVQIGDLVYFGRGEKQEKHPGDAGRGLIVGDPVQAAIDGNDMILQRPDGKEIKTKIIKRQRAVPKP